jgi:hypothetical protein
MPTQTQLEAVRINKVRKAGLDAVDAAVNEDLISIEQWEQAVDDVYEFIDAVEFFVKACAHWSLPEQGRGLVNYLKQYYPQEA